MRGALEKMPGVAGAEVKAGEAEIVVHYDSKATNVDAVIDGLKAAGQPATRK